MEDLFVPPGLVETARGWDTPEGPAWLAELPARVARLAERWELEVGRSFEPGGMCAFVAPVRVRASGTDAVLKVTIPHREATHEGAALRLWDGDGAVRLLAEDAGEHALLLERCRPGTALKTLEDEDEGRVLDTGADLLRRLWRPAPEAHPFETLAEIAAWFRELVVARQEQFGKPLPAALVDEAVEVLRDLPSTADRQVVLHHDFHPGNVLAAEREPWLMIDPKPQVGDPAFDPIQLLLQTGEPLRAIRPPALVHDRLLRVSERAGVDAERVRRWGLARCVEWALWSYKEGRLDWAEESVEFARIFSSIRL